MIMYGEHIFYISTVATTWRVNPLQGPTEFLFQLVNYNILGSRVTPQTKEITAKSAHECSRHELKIVYSVSGCYPTINGKSKCIHTLLQSRGWSCKDRIITRCKIHRS